MSEYMKNTLAMLWLKLLKASVKHKYKKASKIERKIIQLEMEIRYLETKKVEVK